MALPGFNAEASLHKTSTRYRPPGPSFHRNGGSMASGVMPSYIFQRCPPGYWYRCQWVYMGGYERYWECGCFRNYQVALPTVPGL
jgi:hypothetical protein